MPANPNHGGLWTDEVWQNIDASVNSTAMALCVAQKVFPATQLPDVLSVPADTIIPGPPLTMSEGTTRSYVELAVPFTLSNGQVNGDPTGQMAIRAATSAATKLAGAVDQIFFQGPLPPPPPPPAPAPILPFQIAAGTVFPGLLALATANGPIPYVAPAAPPPTTNSGLFILDYVQQGLGRLAVMDQTPAFALILGGTPVAGAAQTAQTLTAASQINGVSTPTVLNPLLTGGIFGTTALPGNVGILIALGGNPTTIFYSDNMLTELVARNNDGSFLFRVFYRTQIAPSDVRSFIALGFP